MCRGLAMVVGIHHSSMSVAGVAYRRPSVPPIPDIVVGPRRNSLIQVSSALAPIGLVVLLAGLIGLGTAVWLWRRRSTRRRGSGFDQDIGMPSYI